MGFKRPLVRIQSLGPRTEDSLLGSLCSSVSRSLDSNQRPSGAKRRQIPPLRAGRPRRAARFESSHSDQEQRIPFWDASVLHIAAKEKMNAFCHPTDAILPVFKDRTARQLNAIPAPFVQLYYIQHKRKMKNSWIIRHLMIAFSKYPW